MVKALRVVVTLLSCWLLAFDTLADEPSPVPSQVFAGAEKSLLLAAASVGSNVLVVGERGHILRLDSQGKLVGQSSSPTNSNLTAVFCLNQSACWAAGHDSVIMFSADAGVSWKIQHWAPSDFNPLFDIWFFSEKHGVAVGAYGLYLETKDGGETWERRVVSVEEEHFYDLFATGDEVFIVGEFGLLLKSLDQGVSWERIKTPYDGSFFGGIGLPKQKQILIYGLRGNLFKLNLPTGKWVKLKTRTTSSLLGSASGKSGDIAFSGLAGAYVYLSAQGKVHSGSFADRVGQQAVISNTDGDFLFFGEKGTKLIERATLFKEEGL